MRTACRWAIRTDVFDVPIRAASFTLAGGGSVALNRANTFPDGIYVNEGYLISRADGALGGGPIRIRDADLYFEGGSQTCGGPFVLDRVIDPLGPVSGHQSVIGASEGDVVTFTGGVSGAGFMRAAGPGTLRFIGDANFERLSFVISGTVEINGTWQATTPAGLSVSFFEHNPTLAGRGTFLGETVAGTGTIAPGSASGAGASRASETGVLTIDRVRGNGTLAIDIVGGGGVSDELAVLTSLTLTGRSLDLNVLSAPALGEAFRIIDARFAGPITGTLTGLPEGATFFADGWNFQITYTGGDGNDVVLTAVVPEPALLPLFSFALLARRRR